MTDTPEAPITTTNEAVEEGASAPVMPAEEKAPQWEGDFDPDRAARLVANLRADLEKAKTDLTNAKSALGEKEETEKSEYQRLQERAERAEKELADTRQTLLVASAARKYGIPEDLHDFLTGSNAEEIEAKASRLAEQISGKRPADDLPNKPKARLVPGSGVAEEAGFDANAVAARIRARI
jgi:DNA repair exonuclease SbcCD ATPase subunit